MILLLLLMLAFGQSRECYTSNGTPSNLNHDLFNGTDCMPCHYRCSQCSSMLPQGCSANSCESYYYYSSNATCERCPANCISCSNSTHCLSCSAGYYLAGAVCQPCLTGASSCSISSVISCQSGYYYNSSQLQCLPCLAHCRSCQNSQACDSCLSGHYYNTTNGSCVPCGANCSSCASNSSCDICSQGFNRTASSTCQPYICSVANCLECPTNSSVCTICNTGYYSKNSQCVAGTSVLCALARGADFGGCLSCSQYSMQPKDTATYCIVKPSNTTVQYQYFTAYNNPSIFGGVAVQLCDHYLTSPKTGLSISVQPPAAYSLEIVVLLAHFTIGENFTYQLSLTPTFNSSVGAVQLWDSQQAATEVCNNQTKLFVRTSTVFPIQSLYTGITVSGSAPFSAVEVLLKFSLCQTPNCSICTSNRCLSCIPPFLLLRGTCVVSCDSGYYTDVVHRSCVYSCPERLYLDPSTYQCLACIAPCATCLSANSCSSCLISPNNQTFLDGSSCLSNCSLNTTYQNSTTVRCQRCKSPCYTCKGTASNCTSCSSGYLLIGNLSGSCVSTCPQGYYGKFTSTSAGCDACVGCLTCSLNSTVCDSCATGSYLIEGACRTTCPLGYYGDDKLWKCVVCSSPCASCTNSSINCTSCALGMLVSDQTKMGKCQSACPSGQYPSVTRQCLGCPIGCRECLSASYCSSCTNVSNSVYYLQYNLCHLTCLTGFMENSSNLCAACKFPCLTCKVDYSGTQCLSCRSGLYLQANTCVQSCPDGSYRSPNDTCLACSANCRTCQDSTLCTSCNLISTSAELADPAFLFVWKNGNCLNKTGCASYEYLAHNITTGQYYCDVCNTSCLACSYYAANCTACSSHLILFNGRCLTACPSGYFNDSGTCLPCSPQCKSCIGNTSNQCQGCNTPYFLIGNSCVTDCSSGYYGSTVTNTCETCPSGCSTCLSGYACTSCANLSGQQYYLLNSRCILSCPVGTVKQSSPTFRCQLCSVTCATCQGTSENCTSCNSGLYIQSLSSLSTWTCSSICPPMQFADNRTMSCQLCSPPCLTCSTQSQCLSCINSSGGANQTYLYQMSCVSSCPDQTFPNTTSLMCQSCSAPCLVCTVSKCLSCSTGHFMYNQSCIVSCPEGLYANQSNSECTKCVPPCTTCRSATVCDSCQSGYSLQSGICLNICPIGTFPSNQSGVCINCSSNCQLCINSSATCTSCSPPLALNLFDSSCTRICPNGTYYSFNSMLRYQCLHCSQTCGNCASFTKCTSCRNQYLLEGTQCLIACSQQYYPSNGVCLRCSSDCLNCLNQSVCLQCVSLFLFNNSCKAECPVGTYQDYLHLMCANCTMNCVSCSSQTNCSVCEQGYAVLGGYCVSLPCHPPYYYRPESRSCLLRCLPTDFYAGSTCYSSCPSTMLARPNSRECVESCLSNQFINSQLQCQACLDADCPQRGFNFSVVALAKSTHIQLVVTFSRAVKSDQSAIGFTISHTANGLIGKRLLSSSPEVSNQQVITLTYEVGTSLRNQLIVVSLPTQYRSGLADAQGNVLQNYQSSVKMDSYDYYPTEGSPALAALLLAVVFALLLILVYLGQHTLIWDAVDYCQMLYFVCLLPVQLPPSVDQYLYAFLAANIKFPVSDAPAVNKSPAAYYLYSGDVNFLRNGACSIIVAASIAAIIGIAWVIQHLKHKIKYQRVVQLSEAVWSRKYTALVVTYLLTSLNIGLFAAAQFFDTNTSQSGYLKVNMVATCIGMVVTIAIPIVICVLLRRQLHQKAKQVCSLSCLLQGVNMSLVEMGQMYSGFRILRRVLWVLLLGLYPLNEVYALSAMLLTSATLISVLVMYRPYVETLRNSLVIAQQAILLGVFATLLLLVLNKSDNINGKLALGAIVQAECTVLIIVSVVYPALTAYRLLKEKADKHNQPPIQAVAVAELNDNKVNANIGIKQQRQVQQAVDKAQQGSILHKADNKSIHERHSSDGSLRDYSSGSQIKRQIRTYDESPSEYASSN